MAGYKGKGKERNDLGVLTPICNQGSSGKPRVYFRRKRERPGDTAYALVYHYVAFAPTWLLSGLRYASCSYALYPMLARVPRKRLGFVLMLALEIALLAGAAWLGLWRTKIY